MRMLNGNLLVRTGGGYQDLLDALGKLPAPTEAAALLHSSAAGASSSTKAGGGGAAGGGAVVGMQGSPMPSPRTPTVTAVQPGKLDSDESPGTNGGRVGGSSSSKGNVGSSSVGLLGATSRHGSSSTGSFKTKLQQQQQQQQSSSSGAPRLDLSGLQGSGLFNDACSTSLLPSARGREAGQQGTLETSGNGSSLRHAAAVAAAGGGGGGAGGARAPQDDMSEAAMAAMEAAVQAAMQAAVEAAANAGLDDGTGTSGGGFMPARGSMQGGQQHGGSSSSRTAQLGRAVAAKTAAGKLIEAGMCPPVPVHEEVSDASGLSARNSTTGGA